MNIFTMSSAPLMAEMENATTIHGIKTLLACAKNMYEGEIITHSYYCKLKIKAADMLMQIVDFQDALENAYSTKEGYNE